MRAAVAVGFLGALVAIRPGGSDFSWILLLPVFTAWSAAVRELLVRRLVRTETCVSLLATASATVTLVALGAAPFLEWGALNWQEVGLLGLAGMFFGFGLYCITDALRYAEASMLSPYKYSSIVWALLFGYLIWGEVPQTLVWLGAALITGSGVYVLHRERILRGT